VNISEKGKERAKVGCMKDQKLHEIIFFIHLYTFATAHTKIKRKVKAKHQNCSLFPIVPLKKRKGN